MLVILFFFFTAILLKGKGPNEPNPKHNKRQQAHQTGNTVLNRYGPKAQNEKPEEEGVDNLPTACTNAQHPVTRVKARINHLPPALQRRGDGLPPTAELKPMKKDAQTEPSSRLVESLPDQTFPNDSIVFYHPSTIDEAKERESIGRRKNREASQTEPG